MKKFLLILFFLLYSINVKSELIYPEPGNNKVIDLSNKFDARYISKLENDLQNSENDIRIVFIKTDNKINLGIYASKLFEKWKLSDDSILVVIDPFTNKRGFAIGKNIKEKLKNRKKVKENKKANELLNNDINYNNLVEAINNKFSPDNLVTSSNNKNKRTFDQKESISLGGSKLNKIHNDRMINIDYYKILKYMAILVIFLIISFLLFFLYKQKKNKDKKNEIINDLSFESNIKLQEISDLIETINEDIEFFKVYKGKTIDYVNQELNSLKDILQKLQDYYEKLSYELENISDENINDINKIIDDFNLLKIDANNNHSIIKEKRKEIKKIIKNSFENISNLRVYLENNLRLVDENSKLYNLELSFIKKILEKINNEIFNIDINDIKNDPIFFKEKISELETSLIQTKNDLEVIPHLYSQINNQINNLFIEKGISNDASLIILKENALKSLNEGNMQKSKELIEKIFRTINEKN
ncbi:MAG: hypothetical protein KatS3mg068_0225 [Candidatus Sericytochromatia bacterium]|nr:MAG: hypothetical protein KatS3mg068_0225 [Candidatus Sericytochromatia bacterium]